MVFTLYTFNTMRKNIIINDKTNKEIEELLKLEEFQEYNVSSLIRFIIHEKHVKKKKEIKERIRELAFEEEGVELPKNKWSRNIEETIKIAKEDWVN